MKIEYCASENIDGRTYMFFVEAENLEEAETLLKVEIEKKKPKPVIKSKKSEVVQ
jgi:hypothetical protein